MLRRRMLSSFKTKEGEDTRGVIIVRTTFKIIWTIATCNFQQIVYFSHKGGQNPVTEAKK